MSMDDVYHTMTVFEQELEAFNERLQASFDDLHNYHETVDPLWQDAMRKEYDAKWLQLEEKMKHYVSVGGVGYTEILLEKLNAIRGYLYGH